MIFINKPVNEAYTLNATQLEILAALEGEEVDKIDKEGIYLTDDFELIPMFPSTKFDLMEDKKALHQRTILYLLSKIKIPRQQLMIYLNQYNNFLNFTKFKGRKQYNFSQEECDIFVSLYYSQKRYLMKYMPLLKIKQFLKDYISSGDLGIAYQKTIIKKYINKNFEHKAFPKSYYYKKNDASAILKCIDELENN